MIHSFEGLIYSCLLNWTTPVLLPGKSHGWRGLEGCSPWGRWGSDMTERLHFHFSLSCIGEGNGNPLQCSCLENPRDGRAWWAAVHGVAQSLGHDWSDIAAAAAKLEAPPAGEEWSSNHKTSSSYYLLLILMAQMVKNLPGMRKTGLDPWVEKIPWMRAWQPTPVFLPGESPWTEETGGLQPMGSQRVGHDWATKHTHTHNSISNCGRKSKEDWVKLLYKLF